MVETYLQLFKTRAAELQVGQDEEDGRGSVGLHQTNLLPMLKTLFSFVLRAVYTGDFHLRKRQQMETAKPNFLYNLKVKKTRYKTDPYLLYCCIEDLC